MPSAMLSAGDTLADLIRSAKVAEIDFAAASSDVIAAKAGKRFVILHLYLQVSANTNITLKSDTTEISGDMACTSTAPLELKNNGVPVALGSDINKKFTIASSAAGASNVDGFVIYTLVDTK